MMFLWNNISVLFNVFIIYLLICVYRNWRYEQEIAGLLWKIHKEDLRASLHGHNNQQFVLEADKKDTYSSRVKFRLSHEQKFRNLSLLPMMVLSLWDFHDILFSDLTSTTLILVNVWFYYEDWLSETAHVATIDV